MIKIRCHTNIDCCKRLQWPEYLPERPVVGDLIRSTSSTNNKHIELRVVETTWVFTKDAWPTNIHNPKDDWVLEVELHLPLHRFECIIDFENWIKGRERWSK